MFDELVSLVGSTMPCVYSKKIKIVSTIDITLKANTDNFTEYLHQNYKKYLHQINVFKDVCKQNWNQFSELLIHFILPALRELIYSPHFSRHILIPFLLISCLSVSAFFESPFARIPTLKKRRPSITERTLEL